MTQQRLRCFIAVAETLSFSKAAELLFITQPALSRQIEKLEEELGCVLFERNKHSMSLTKSGMICLRYSKNVLDGYDNLLGAMNVASNAMVGTVHLGYAGRSNLSLVVNLLNQMKKQHPYIHIEIRKDNIKGLQWGLKSDVDDMVFLFEPCVEDWMEYKLIQTGKMDAVLPIDHPLAKETSIPISALKGERFVSSRRDNQAAIYDKRIELCMRAGFSPNLEKTVSSAEAAVIEVSVNGYVTMLPSSAIDPGIPGIAVVPIEKTDCSFNIVAAWKKDSSNPLIPVVLGCF